MKIAVLYDGGAADWCPQDIQSVLEPVATVSRALRSAGHRVVAVPVQPGLTWFDAVRRCDLVFNLCEGVGGISHLEYKVASVLDLAGIRYTGGSAWTMTVCHRKPLLNAVLAAEALPVPEWVVPNGDVPDPVPLPALVKPAAEDASVGVDQGSVVTTRAELEARVAKATRQFGEVIVQRYVAGREFAVAFVGDETLPLSEIDFSRMPGGAWPILSFDAKWKPGSPEDRGTRPVCPARVDDALAARLVATARAAWRAVRGYGYGRVDFRVDADGRPWVLEVNPNPDISTDAGLANMARAAGWTYDELVLRILGAAMGTPDDLPPFRSAELAWSAAGAGAEEPV